MAIQSVSSINDILRNYDAKEWTKTASVDEFKDIQMPKMPGLEGAEIGESSSPKSFLEVLGESIGEVNSLQKDADKAIQKLATGESKNIHETMLAVEQAEMAFKTMNQVRNKVIDAYKEIMRMQV